MKFNLRVCSTYLVVTLLIQLLAGCVGNTGATPDTTVAANSDIARSNVKHHKSLEDASNTLINDFIDHGDVIRGPLYQEDLGNYDYGLYKEKDSKQPVCNDKVCMQLGPDGASPVVIETPDKETLMRNRYVTYIKISFIQKVNSLDVNSIIESMISSGNEERQSVFLEQFDLASCKNTTNQFNVGSSCTIPLTLISNPSYSPGSLFTIDWLIDDKSFKFSFKVRGQRDYNPRNFLAIDNESSVVWVHTDEDNQDASSTGLEYVFSNKALVLKNIGNDSIPGTNSNNIPTIHAGSDMPDKFMFYAYNDISLANAISWGYYGTNQVTTCGSSSIKRGDSCIYPFTDLNPNSDDGSYYSQFHDLLFQYKDILNTIKNVVKPLVISIGDIVPQDYTVSNATDKSAIVLQIKNLISDDKSLMYQIPIKDAKFSLRYNPAFHLGYTYPSPNNKSNLIYGISNSEVINHLLSNIVLSPDNDCLSNLEQSSLDMTDFRQCNLDFKINPDMGNLSNFEFELFADYINPLGNNKIHQYIGVVKFGRNGQEANLQELHADKITDDGSAVFDGLLNMKLNNFIQNNSQNPVILVAEANRLAMYKCMTNFRPCLFNKASPLWTVKINFTGGDSLNFNSLRYGSYDKYYLIAQHPNGDEVVPIEDELLNQEPGNNKGTLELQADGNFVAYGSSPKRAVWASGTNVN